MGELWDNIVGWFSAELAANDITLQAPWFLLLLLALPYLAIVPFWTLADLPRWQQALSVLVRACVVTLLALALVRPSHVTKSAKVAAVFLVDVSESVPDDSLRRAEEFVAAAWQARGEHHVEVVTFAGTPKRITIPKEATALPKLARHKVDAQESDLQGAVQFAFGLYPPGMLRRMVVLSDGYETRGDFVAAAQAARQSGIRLFTHAFDAPAAKEMLLRGVYMPEKVSRGSPFKIRVEVFSNHEGEAQLSVMKDGVLESGFPRAVKLKKGTTDVVFQSLVKETGTARYEVKLTPPAGSDRFAGNNQFTESVYVAGKPRVLVVEGGAPRDARYLQAALSQEKFDVDVRGRYGVPDSAADLEKYDAVIYSDLPAFDHRETYVTRRHLAALRAYVTQKGGGFIMAGGQQSFGPGGHGNTAMEEMLPVRFDVEKKKDTPSLALLLIIDKSGSMGGLKMDLTKQAARAAVNLLGPQDQAGVIVFDSAPYRLARLQSAANKARIEQDIARVMASGGTAIFPALEMGYQELAGTRAKIKHAVLLTDGQAPRQGIVELVQNMAAENITVSTIGVGADADMVLLRQMAAVGNGRAYYTNDAYSLPKIFVKETSTVARSAVVDLPFRPRVTKPAQVLKGIDFSAGPYLLGYVATKSKPQAEVLLVSDYGEPILARWRQGLGKTVAWTSDIKNRWSQEWVGWSGYARFWGQLVRDVMKRKLHENYDMRARIVAGRAIVAVDAVSRAEMFINGLESSVTVTDPKRTKRTLPLTQVAPGRYEASFPVGDYGSYVLEAEHRLEGQVVATSHGGVAYPFPAELMFFGVHTALLERAAAIGGGKLGPTPGEPYEKQGEELVSRREELWSYFLYFALALFILDLFLRRVRLGRLRPLSV
jgi:uncharacterized membrane protein